LSYICDAYLNSRDMKKIVLFIYLLLPLLALSQESASGAQQTTIRRISVGAEIFQDFWLNKPTGMNVRGINQGGGAFFLYSFPFGKSNFSFAIGAGVGFHNLYSNTLIDNIKADTITFSPIPDTVSYKKSKLGLSYIDFPIEFRLKTNNKVRASVGVKLGYLIDAKTKYKGDNEFGNEIIIKTKGVSHVDKFRFGPTVRVGYDWFQVMGYFSVTKLFDKNKGPDLYPISVGITLMPF